MSYDWSLMAIVVLLKKNSAAECLAETLTTRVGQNSLCTFQTIWVRGGGQIKLLYTPPPPHPPHHASSVKSSLADLSPFLSCQVKMTKSALVNERLGDRRPYCTSLRGFPLIMCKVDTKTTERLCWSLRPDGVSSCIMLALLLARLNEKLNWVGNRSCEIKVNNVLGSKYFHVRDSL